MTNTEKLDRWKALCTEFMTMLPTDPRCGEVYREALALDKELRAAGVLPPVR